MKVNIKDFEIEAKSKLSVFAYNYFKAGVDDVLF